MSEEEEYGTGGTDPINPAPTANPTMPDMNDPSEATEEMSALGGVAAEEAANSGIIETPDYEGKSFDEISDKAGVVSGAGMIDQNKASTTVAGQLSALLDADSAYIKNAQRKAQQQATALGLGSSSMAAGASVRAAIESALPIAQQDAETYSRAVLAEQETYNTISKNIADGIVTADLKHYSNVLDQAMVNKNAQMQILIDTAQQQNNLVAQGYLTQLSKQMDHFTSTTMANLESKLKVALQNQQITHEEKMQTQNLTASIIAGTQAEMMQMMQDPDFLSSFLNAKDPDNPTTEENEEAYRLMMEFLNKNIMGPAIASANFVAASMGLGKDYYGTGGSGSWLDTIFMGEFWT